jgi:general secretion pathway protein K
MNRRFSSQRGVALILVLWVTILLTVIAGSFAYATRADMSVLGNHVQRARAEAAADAGVHRAVLESFRPITDPVRWKNDGSEHEFRLGEAQVRVSVLDESAKIDINEGSPALLKGLLLSVGLPEPEAAKLADAIQDWRDPDTLSRPDGAEEEAYKSAGLKQKPSNAPFQTLEELRLVMGMTTELYRRIEPMITIYSRQPGINLAIASREVLLAIPGATAAQVEAFIAARAAALAARQPLPPFPQATAFGAVPNMMGLQVRSTARLDGTEFERVAVVRVIPDPRRPFTAMAWGEGRSITNMNAETAPDGR